MASACDRDSAADSSGMSDTDAGDLWRTFLHGPNPHGLAAFDRLYANFLPLVIRYCRFRLRDTHLAEDVANTVFVRLLETKPVLRSSFVGLLLRTARNLCASELANQRRFRRVEAGLVEPDEPNPGHDLERRDEHAALSQCLARLSEDDQTLVVLHDGEGLTYRQIRDVLGLRGAFSTFSKRLKRIKDRLRRCLKEKNIF